MAPASPRVHRAAGTSQRWPQKEAHHVRPLDYPSLSDAFATCHDAPLSPTPLPSVRHVVLRGVSHSQFEALVLPCLYLDVVSPPPPLEASADAEPCLHQGGKSPNRSVSMGAGLPLWRGEQRGPRHCWAEYPRGPPAHRPAPVSSVPMTVYGLITPDKSRSALAKRAVEQGVAIGSGGASRDVTRPAHWLY